jgi:hypothetical protein
MLGGNFRQNLFPIWSSKVCPHLQYKYIDDEIGVLASYSIRKMYAVLNNCANNSHSNTIVFTETEVVN